MRKAKVALSIFWAAILLYSFLVIKKLRTGTFSTFVNSVFQWPRIQPANFPHVFTNQSHMDCTAILIQSEKNQKLLFDTPKFELPGVLNLLIM